MAVSKKIGIWMDHANANLMEFNPGRMDTIVINSNFTHQEKEESLKKSENLMHHKEQHEQAHFYKEIAEAIKNYDNVLLFGPTTAKSELFNLVNKDPLFSHIRFDVKPADKMTEYQQYTFVREFFAVKV
jgi:nitrogenase subunit NifH